MPFSLYDTAPDCVAGGVPPDAGTIAPYERCTDFFTFGAGGAYTLDGSNPVFGDASTGTLVLTALGFAAMVIALVGWVRLEHVKLTTQAARLRAAAVGAPVGTTAPAPGTTPEDPTRGEL
jgi:hypothetical protein